MAKNRGICAAHTCIPQYREYPPPPGRRHGLDGVALRGQESYICDYKQSVVIGRA